MKILKRMAAILAASSIAAVSVAAASISVSAEETIATAYLAGTIGTNQSWDNGATAGTLSITGDATYTVAWDMTDASETGDSWFLAVFIEPAGTTENFTPDTFENLNVTLDAVYVDGVSYTNLSDAYIDMRYYDGGAGLTRIYLHDNWAGTQTVMLSDMTIESNVTVTFTVSGTGFTGTNASMSNAMTDANGGGTTDDTSSQADTTADSSTDASESSTSDSSSSGSDSSASSSDSSSSSSSSSSGSSSSGSGSSSSGSSSSSGGSSSESVSETGDFGIAAVALGAVAACALGAGAFTVTRRKK